MSGFTIAEVPVLAGWLGICPLPGHYGDYHGDLGAIHAWAPDMVLSLASRGEMHGVADGFGTDLGRNGVAWRHFPITDYGVPTEAEDAIWPMLARCGGASGEPRRMRMSLRAARPASARAGSATVSA